MYQSLMHADLAAARQRDLIAAAADHRLAEQASRGRQARRSRRAGRRNNATNPVRLGTVRLASTGFVSDEG